MVWWSRALPHTRGNSEYPPTIIRGPQLTHIRAEAHRSLTYTHTTHTCRAAAVIELDERNFEHLTQAATGATSGDWLVLFCKESVARCGKVQTNWQRVATTLAASREAKGLPRINVATVDTSTSSWLRKRFAIQSVPVVLLFKGGVMYSFHGGGALTIARAPFARRRLSLTHCAVPGHAPSTTVTRRAPRLLIRVRVRVRVRNCGRCATSHRVVTGFSVERLVQFAERDYERSNRMLVPPEPHVATPHDQTFLITIGAVAAGAAVLYLVDQARLTSSPHQPSSRPLSLPFPPSPAMCVVADAADSARMRVHVGASRWCDGAPGSGRLHGA